MLLTPLELPGWLEFNTWRTGLKVSRFSSPGADGPEARAVFYYDRRGRLKLPPNNPYMPVVFESARQRPSGRTHEWLRAAGPLAQEMRHHGTANAIALPPVIDDVRPWRWGGFLVGVAYTYCLNFPVDPSQMDRTQKQHVDSAARLGMIVDRPDSLDPVWECLAETEARKGFSHRIGLREIRSAQSLLGKESLRTYVCFDRDGQPASACVVIHAPGTRAIGWMAGTKTAQLRSGAGHLVWRFAFDDLYAQGATGVDLCGANIPPVAEFKARWGSQLVPFYNVRTYSVRTGARFLADWRSSRRNREDN